MDATTWIDLQESLLWFFAPFFQQLLMLLIAGGVMAAIGVVIMDTASRISR